MKHMLKKCSGFSFVELMLSITIMSMFFTSVVLVYTYVGRVIVTSRTRTVANNLAQEKLEELKDITYYRLRPTSLLDYLNLGYDNTYYPREFPLTVGNIMYERRVVIRRIQENADGDLIEVNPDDGNTDLKKVIVTVLWTDKHETKSLSITNFRDNPNRRTLDGRISGTITDQDTAANLGEVKIVVVDNLNWNDITDSNGDYSIDVPTGTYQVKASKDGYWLKTSDSLSVTDTSTDCDLALKERGSGTISGYAFYNNHLVISQVVGSSVTVDSIDQEFVELYNPTTYYIQMVTGFAASLVSLYYQKGGDPSPTEIPVTYSVMDASVAPSSYFLIANTNTISTCGITRTADAVYATPGADTIKTPYRGGVALKSAGAWIDKVGWQKSSVDPEIYETTPIQQVVGFSEGEQFVRKSYPGGIVSNCGRAYDSADNENDFIDTTTIIYPPRNSSDTETVISGVPAISAIISADDSLSTPTTAYATGTPPYAEFQLTSVATGTWAVVVFYNTSNYTAYREITNIELANDGDSVNIPNASTDPIWPAVNYNNVIVSSSASFGFITGQVISGGAGVSSIKVESGVNFTYSGTNGYYTLRLDPGLYNLTANPNNLNNDYTSLVITTVPVTLGQITSGIDFDISPGGAISGTVESDASDPLPNVLVMAYDYNSNEITSVLTESDGSFVISNLPTSGNDYKITPILDSGESSTPASRIVTVTAGNTVDEDRDGSYIEFEVTSAYGSLEGTVKYDGELIKTGVLIIATTSTIASNPPDIDYTLRSGTNLYYGTFSKSDGTYTLYVRGGNSYNVYAWYTTMDNGVPDTDRDDNADNSISAGTSVTVNFTWP